MHPVCMLRASPLVAGDNGRIEIELVVDGDIRVSYVDVDVVAREGWTGLEADRGTLSNAIYPIAYRRVMEAGVLPVGTTRFFVDIEVPGWLAPSHHIAPAYNDITVRIHVARPHWPDFYSTYALASRRPPPASLPRTMVEATGTRLALRLASSRWIAGEDVVGWCKVVDRGAKKPLRIRIAAEPTLTLHGALAEQRPGHAITTAIEIADDSEVPFHLPLPVTLTPSFRGRTHDLAWALTAHAGSFFGPLYQASIPIEIIDAAALATTKRVAFRPSLAEENAAVAFTRFADANGWHVDDDGPAIERDRLRIGYDERDGAGIFVARIATPSLGLGLHVTPCSALQGLLPMDIQVGAAGWDADYFVRARDAEQTAPVLHPIVETLQRAGALGTLVRWTDDELVFERAATDELAPIAADMASVAAAVEAARYSIAPPPELVVNRPAWRELARWLDGTLGLGDLSIAGSLVGMRVRIGLRFDRHAKADAVVAAVGTPVVREDSVMLALARPAHAALRAPPGVSDLLMTWPASFVDLRIADGVASAAWLIDEDRVVDVDRARELVESLRAIVATLTRATGPYR